VAGIGEQRGRMREHAVHRLHRHDQHVQPDRQRERASLPGLRRVMMVMPARAVVVAMAVVMAVTFVFIVTVRRVVRVIGMIVVVVRMRAHRSGS
jgi:hypothetical protein